MDYQKKLYIKSDITKTKNYLGHKLGKNLFVRRLHPSISLFLLGIRDNVSIINFHKGFHFLIKALYVISRIIKKNGHLLIVNTNPDFSRFIENLIQETSISKNISYCNSKWVGGTLTNWGQVSKSIITFARFSERFGTFIATNKIYFPRYKKMKKSFQGFINKNEANISVSLKKKPDIILVLNPNENQNVIDEAIRLNIPVIAITDSNTKILGMDYPIPANNNSVEFIHLFFSWIIRLIRKI